MSCSSSDRTSPETVSGRLPRHNWRPTVVHGALLWSLLLVGTVLVPAGHPLGLGLTLAGVFVVPTLPVALYCDYRQARRFGTCDPGVRGYLRNLGWDVATTLACGVSLGDARRRFDTW